MIDQDGNFHADPEALAYMEKAGRALAKSVYEKYLERVREEEFRKWVKDSYFESRPESG